MGYVCGTKIAEHDLTYASMRTHEPDGRTLCIHSVCVHPALRRRGLATRLLRAYVARLDARSRDDVATAVLIAKPDKVGLYQRVGFVDEGPSAVRHGGEEWHQCRMNFPRNAAESS